MRALKTILIILGAVIGLWLILCLIGPSESTVERSVTMKASPETIYAYVHKLKNMDEWGVWRKSDPNAKYEFIGEDGTVGAKSTWDGEVVSQGSQTITALEPNKSVKTDLAFGSMVSHASIDLTPKGADSTLVTWSLHGETPFLFRGMGVLMSMDQMVGPDFQTGLDNLKTISEARQAEADKANASPAFDITTADRPAMLYVGKREVVKWADMKDFFGKNFGAGMGAIGKAGVQPAGAPSGVYFEWNEKDMTADMIAGIPVAADAKAKLKGLDLYEVPASKALVIDYRGGYNGLGKAHEAMDAYLTEHKDVVHHTNVIEEYLTDPGSEPDSTKWLTRIVYLVK